MKRALSGKVDGRIYIFYVPYIHNPESARIILLSQLKKENVCLGKLAIDTLDFSMMKKMAANL